MSAMLCLWLGMNGKGMKAAKNAQALLLRGAGEEGFCAGA
jgi:hypothetical protein